MALHNVDGLGPIRLKKIIDYFNDPKLAWEAKSKDLEALQIPYSIIENLEKARKEVDALEYVANLENSGIKFLTIFDDSYPKRLRQIYNPPIVIYYKGEILSLDDRALAVVGTRKVTGYGRTVTHKFTSDLVQNQFTIVSGLARGVDTVAHQTALEAGGRTIAVLGGGLNKIFPPENARLASEIIKGHGAVISEFPPDYPALAGNFPSRNRIIAGLAIGVLVTEAAEDSGSLITAKLALEEGREVFAVPGPITSSLSKGPAELIKQGAMLAFSTEDILHELGISGKQGPTIADGQANLKLSEIEKLILEKLENETKHIDLICRELGKTISEVSSSLVKMEIIGLVKNLGGGNYVKTL